MSKPKVRKYIKADDGEYIEVGGENGHINSVRKILKQRFGSSRRYGWIHGSSCKSCGMDSEYFKKSPCPVKHKFIESEDDLMSLHKKPTTSMDGMLESWS